MFENKNKINKRDLVQLGHDFDGLFRQNLARPAVAHAHGDSPLELDCDVAGVVGGFFHVTGHRVHVGGGDVIRVLQNTRLVTGCLNYGK